MIRLRQISRLRWLAAPAALTVLFGLGIQIGLACWGRLTLPYHNPWGVAGQVILDSYNPANNNLRFIVLLAMPILLLFGGYFACPRRLRDWLAPKEAPAPPAPAGRRSYLLLAALVLVCILAALNRETEIAWGPLDSFHEGESLGTSVSYTHGQAPYRDFIVPHGMFADPLRAVLAFRLFGRSIGAARTIQSGLKTLEFLLLGLSFLILFEGSYLWAFTALALFGIPLFLPLLNSDLEVWYLCQFVVRDVTVFAFLAAILAFKNNLSQPTIRSSRVIIGGFLCSFIPLASIGYSADRGIYLVSAAVLLSLILYLRYLRESRLRMHYAASSALGILSGVLLLEVITRGGLLVLIKHVYVTEPRYFGLLNGFIYPIAQLPWKATLILVAVNAYWVAFKLLQQYHFSERDVVKTSRGFTDAHFPEFALLVLSLLLFTSAVVRPDWPHMAVGSAFPYLLTAVILARHYFSRMPQKITKAYAILVAVGLLVWSVFGVNRILDQELIGENFPFKTPDSEFVPSNYNETVDFLKSNLAADEYFLALNSDGMWYYLVDKPCPIRFSDVFYAATDFYQREVVEELKHKKVKFIIYQNDYWTNMIDGFPTADRLPIIVRYVNEDYEPYTLIDDNEIWRAKVKPG